MALSQPLFRKSLPDLSTLPPPTRRGADEYQEQLKLFHQKKRNGFWPDAKTLANEPYDSELRSLFHKEHHASEWAGFCRKFPHLFWLSFQGTGESSAFHVIQDAYRLHENSEEWDDANADIVVADTWWFSPPPESFARKRKRKELWALRDQAAQGKYVPLLWDQQDDIKILASHFRSMHIGIVFWPWPLFLLRPEVQLRSNLGPDTFAWFGAHFSPADEWPLDRFTLSHPETWTVLVENA